MNLKTINKSYNLATIAALVVLLTLNACGPVKFSSSSKTGDATTDGSGTNTPQGTTPNNGGTGTTDNNGGNNGGQTGTTTQTKDVVTTYNVTSKQNKVDIILVVDNSSSMTADNLKLADRLSAFVTQLESSAIDWQMCLTVTSAIPYNNYNYFGMSIDWSDYTGEKTWILKKGTANLPTIFRNTMLNKLSIGAKDTNDERGIKAAYWHASYKDYNLCYRQDAALAHIIISDEDERSIGGVVADKYYDSETQALEADDEPANLVQKIKDVFGTSKRVRSNTIIVKPNDSNCLSTQDAQGTKAHYGRKYSELSSLTGGGVGSICDDNYSSNLQYFNEVIDDSLAAMPLECNPYNNAVSVNITPAQGNITTTVQGQSLVFSPNVTAGSTIVANYKCVLATNRVPNSVEEPSWLSKLHSWLIQPILNWFAKL